GASPWLAAAAGILVNLRNGVYGMAVSPLLPRGWRRALGAHLVNDETVAFATSPSPAAAPAATAHRGRVATFWVAGIGVALGWPVGAAMGAGLGLVVSDPRVWGLDAVLPALLGALAVPAIRAGRTLAVAVLAAVIALVTTPLVPAGLAPVLALAALAVVLVLVGTVAAVWLLSRLGSSADPTPTAQATSTLALGTTAPTPTDLTATRVPGGVEVTWVNPSPRTGDTYAWSL
ncbi:AzlC family ABC transporter permease, partial [Cutibacterium acnes]